MRRSGSQSLSFIPKVFNLNDISHLLKRKGPSQNCFYKVKSMKLSKMDIVMLKHNIESSIRQTEKCGLLLHRTCIDPSRDQFWHAIYHCTWHFALHLVMEGMDVAALSWESISGRSLRTVLEQIWRPHEETIQPLYSQYSYIVSMLCHLDTVHQESVHSTLSFYIFCYDTALFQNEVNSTHNAEYWQCEKVSPIGTEQCLISSKHDTWHSHQIIQFL